MKTEVSHNTATTLIGTQQPSRIQATRLTWTRPIAILLLFGIAFGYLEAAVVTYLRLLHEPASRQFYPNRGPDQLFPLLTLDQVRAAGLQRALFTEIGREAATMLMLAAIALAVSRNARELGAAFAIAFGVWDIVFYASLKLLIGWPASLLTWDILFLIPVPWVGPVAAPVLVSLAMIGAGIWCFRREAARRPLAIRYGNIAGVLLGALVIIVSFTLDCRNILAGGAPRPFHWGVFAVGLVFGSGSYLLAGASSLTSRRSR